MRSTVGNEEQTKYSFFLVAEVKLQQAHVDGGSAELNGTHKLLDGVLRSDWPDTRFTRSGIAGPTYVYSSPVHFTTKCNVRRPVERNALPQHLTCQQED